MAYASYRNYTGDYLGSQIPPEAFPGVGAKASAYIDRLTQSRAQAGDINVILACCAIAEVLYSEQKRAEMTAQGAITSESVGGHSVSYAAETPEGEAARLKGRIRSAAALYLADSGLLFRGV